MGYDASTFSKAERGIVSDLFIAKFLEKISIDDETKIILEQYQEKLKNAKAINKQIINASTPTNKKRKRIPWPNFIKTNSLIKQLTRIFVAVFLLLLITLLIKSSTHNKQRMVLGPIDFHLACIDQYPNDPQIKAILLNENNVNSWKCKLMRDGTPLPSDIDAMLACRTQYSTEALAAYDDPNDAYSWYCYLE